MKKILIIGSAGAGKTTFAKRLGVLTGIEVVHLDRLYWKPDWIEPEKDEWKKIVERAVQREEWIIDGNYGGTLEIRMAAGDTIIFLEMPRLLCVYRVLKRAVKYRKKNRPDMADGCLERFDWKFVKWVWNYPVRTKPTVDKLLERFANKTIVRLKSKAEVENFLLNYSPASVLK